MRPLSGLLEATYDLVVLLSRHVLRVETDDDAHCHLQHEMRKLLIAGIVSVALVFAASASAALVPGVFDPGNTGCVEATFIKKTKRLHLEKNCPTATSAAAGADLTKVSGQTFQSASFTLASTA